MLYILCDVKIVHNVDTQSGPKSKPILTVTHSFIGHFPGKPG